MSSRYSQTSQSQEISEKDIASENELAQRIGECVVMDDEELNVQCGLDIDVDGSEIDKETSKVLGESDPLIFAMREHLKLFYSQYIASQRREQLVLARNHPKASAEALTATKAWRRLVLEMLQAIRAETSSKIAIEKQTETLSTESDPDDDLVELLKSEITKPVNDVRARRLVSEPNTHKPFEKREKLRTAYESYRAHRTNVFHSNLDFETWKFEIEDMITSRAAVRKLIRLIRESEDADSRTSRQHLDENFKAGTRPSPKTSTGPGNIKEFGSKATSKRDIENAFRRIGTLNSTKSEYLKTKEVQAHAGSTTQLGHSPDLIDYLKEKDASVRLINALEWASGKSRLPAITIDDFFNLSPVERKRKFLHLPNLGRKSFDELEELLSKKISSHVLGNTTEHQVGSRAERLHYLHLARQAAEQLFGGLMYPDELLELSPAAHLANLLELEKAECRVSFFDFLKSYDDATARLRARPNCGRKSLQELDELVSEHIQWQLQLHGLDSSLHYDMRRLIGGEELPDIDVKALYDLLCGVSPKPFESASNVVLEVDVKSAIDRWLGELELRACDVISRRYGIGGQSAETLQEIAEHYSITRERIRQIEQKAKKRMATTRNIKSLGSALAREDVVSKLFVDRKIIVPNRLSIASQSLDPHEILAIDLAYGSLTELLNTLTVKIESGWVQEENLLEVEVEQELLSRSLRQRLIDAILTRGLPLSVSELMESIPDYGFSSIKSELIDKLDAKIEGDVLRTAPGLPAQSRYLFVLREAGRAMHCNEIRARNHELFGRDESIRQIRSALAANSEALIVARGTYDLYINLSLTESDLSQIRDRTYDYLLEMRGFISIKVIYAEVFQGDTERFGVDFIDYMLLGILQDDARFDVRRGLMVGLTSDNADSEFRSLSDEVLAVLFESGRAMSLAEIAKALEGRRDVLSTSISNALDASEAAVPVGRGRYDLTENVIGDEQAQEQLASACLLTLAEGPKTVFALSELINPICGDLQTLPLKGFLENRPPFMLDGDFVSLSEVPNDVERYVRERNRAAEHKARELIDITNLRDVLSEKDIPDLIDLDPILSSIGSSETLTEKDEILDQLLGDFGIH